MEFIIAIAAIGAILVLFGIKIVPQQQETKNEGRG